MGISLSTARLLAPASFIFNLLCQTWAMNISSPNLLQVHNKYIGAFSPWPYAVGIFFTPQMILELAWLRELWRADSKVEQAPIDYSLWFSGGNFAIGIWSFFWNSENLKIANIFVVLNSLSSLYYVYARRSKNPSTYQQKLTNAVAISFAGIGLMDLVHNGSAAHFTGMAPNKIVQAITTIAPPIASLVSPSLMGASIVFDLLALSYGQSQLVGRLTNGGGGGQGWANILGTTGAVCAAAVGLRHFNGANWL